MRKAVIAVAAGGVVLCGAVLLWAFGSSSPSPRTEVEAPRDQLPHRPTHTDHAKLIPADLTDGPSVTRACLSCHPNSAHEVMQTSHWTWMGQKVNLPGTDRVVQVGKANVINNFCIHAGPNIESCSSCHAGYGWKDGTFDFSNRESVDCLVCHDQTGLYEKGQAGLPKPGVDLMASAKSVGRPTRRNCGQCHFKGGGGDAVKHGDLDGTMYFPSERLDVHMGHAGLQCVDCHRTEHHVIPGLAMSIAPDRPQRVACTDCHSPTPHHDRRLDAHTRSVACETCHIPRMAIDSPTKMSWDWSAAGQDLPEDPHHYLKKKGRFTYAQNVRPEYYWYNGQAERYLTGDKIDPAKTVQINRPLGGPGDTQAKIFPFKVHRGKQPFDKVHSYLLTPKTFGPGGYWNEFDWDKACRLGAQETGLAYSGQYGFVETEMYWPLSHMVQAKEKTLQCTECHRPDGLMNWQALGFPGDPAFRGRPMSVAPPVPSKAAKPDGPIGLPEGERANTGWIFSAQRMSDSPLNLKDKDRLSRPWDVHAARLLDCTSCHVPIEGKTAPATAAEASASAPWFRVTRGCSECHRTEGTHRWLPEAPRHLASLRCESCHIPQVHAPAVRQLDWTSLSEAGRPRIEWRGVEGDPQDPAALISGFRPVLLPRTDRNGKSQLAPHNLVAAWYWTGNQRTEAIHPKEIVAALRTTDGQYRADLSAALDTNHDGRVSAEESVLDTAEKLAAVRRCLTAEGIADPQIAGELHAYPLHHGVAPAKWATRSCDTCHQGNSQLNQPVVLAGQVPGDVLPQPVPDERAVLEGKIEATANGAVYQPADLVETFYVPGHARWRWIDWLGGLMLAGVLGGVSVHAGLRINARRARGFRGTAEGKGGEAAS